MAVSEAQKKSAQKWDAANLDRVSIAMPKGMKDTVKAAATVAGESMNQYIIGATDKRLTATHRSAARRGGYPYPHRTQNSPGGGTESRGDNSCIC